ncbi:MAG TPA: response regulator [Magnetospirillaceae bacterium]|jgi:CheY-like chemotaxis protein
MASAARYSPNGDKNHKTVVLVVEDEVNARTAAAEYLREAGFIVIEAWNGDEAVAIFRSQTHIDVVFSDVRMPGSMDGFTLERWIAEHYPATPVLLTSGVLEIRGNAISDYGRRFMSKPYIFADVEQRIRDLIGY